MSDRESQNSQSQSLGFNLSQRTFDTMLHNMFPSMPIATGFKTVYTEEKSTGSSPDQLEFTLEKTCLGVTGVNPYTDTQLHDQSSFLHESQGSAFGNSWNQPLTLMDALGFPTNVPVAGVKGFGIEFPEEKRKLTKSAPWTYSAELNKLFVKIGTYCPITFISDGTLQPGDAFLRVMPVFKLPQDVKMVIRRCSHHIQKNEDRHNQPDHLIITNHVKAEYQECPLTGRLSVVVPFEPIDQGQAVHMFAFMCFSSCVGSLNRRPCHVIFSLEQSGQVIGRQTLDIRVCACPGRDKRNELNPMPRKNSEIRSTSMTATPPPACNGTSRVTTTQELDENNQSLAVCFAKRVKQEEDDDKIYYVPVKGRKSYELVMKMAEGLALLEHMSHCDEKYLERFRKLSGRYASQSSGQQVDRSTQNSESSTSSSSSCTGDGFTFRLKRTISASGTAHAKQQADS
ncbi:cellular tumor antigen p53-like [Corticium candelabrum]|uniref:cellular tumor antigen p53-like n=1 Tax=Corticium candelabrum TaxID=121492 RepID=UPI002E256755|nr:cellular tumor antigen p53-like [Corticium candelabrum]